MKWRPIRVDSAAVTRNHRIDPPIVQITIENLKPAARYREAELIRPPCFLAQTDNDNQVFALTVQPPMFHVNNDNRVLGPKSR